MRLRVAPLSALLPLVLLAIACGGPDPDPRDLGRIATLETVDPRATDLRFEVRATDRPYVGERLMVARGDAHEIYVTTVDVLEIRGGTRVRARRMMALERRDPQPGDHVVRPPGKAGE